MHINGPDCTIFLPVESCFLAFLIFIAWLTLIDFGIQTCFYNGMDAYSKTWLQFVLPVYILVLADFMIMINHFVHVDTFAKLLGNNSVSVLATRTCLPVIHKDPSHMYIDYLCFKSLTIYLTYNRMVCMAIQISTQTISQHNTFPPLCLVAVFMFLFLFLPYTLLLLFDQWLQAISHLRFFSWVYNARLKPFMDVYHGLYKAKHCYWPGLLLVSLCSPSYIGFAFQFNPQQDRININLLSNSSIYWDSSNVGLGQWRCL